MSLLKQMNVSSTKSRIMPIRYIAITGSTAKSCKRLKLLLKQTNYYCLVDCYKTTDELVSKESFYIPDFAIVEVRSVCSIFSVGKKINSLKDVFPGIKILLYYNMLRRYPLLEQKHGQYISLHLRDDEQKLLSHLDQALQLNNNCI